MKLYEEILKAAAGQEIESIVIGKKGTRWEEPPKEPSDVLSWKEVFLTLDQDTINVNWETMPAIIAWTKDRVIITAVEEVWLNVVWVPRNPCKHSPIFVQ
jgi:hypothetical protein